MEVLGALSSFPLRLSPGPKPFLVDDDIDMGTDNALGPKELREMVDEEDEPITLVFSCTNCSADSTSRKNPNRLGGTLPQQLPRVLHRNPLLFGLKVPRG